MTASAESLLRGGVWLLALAGAALGIANMVALVASDLPGDYVEGVVLAAQTDVLAGRSPYERLAWATPPYRINLYGPAGYRPGAWIAAAVGAEPGSLVPGRMASVAALAAALGAAWTLARRRLGLGRRAAALAVVAPLGMLPVVVFGAQNRVDVIAVACSAWGLVAAAEPVPRRWLAAPLFVLAVFVKPTAIAAVAAVGLWWLWRRQWRAIVVTTLLCLALGSIWLVRLALVTDGAFFESLFRFNALPFAVGGLSSAASRAFAGGVLPVAAALALVLVLRADDDGRLAGLWMLTATAVAIATVGRVGANVNYFVEACVAAGPILALVFERARRSPSGGRGDGLVAASIGLALAGASLVETGPRVVWEHRGRSERETVERRLAVHVGPGDAVLTTEVVSAMRIGAHPWLNDPFIFARLAEAGTWDESRLLEDLRSGRVLWIIAGEDLRADGSSHSNWSAAVRQVASHWFREVDRAGRFRLYRFTPPGEA